MAKPITRIHFNVLKPLNRKNEAISIIISLTSYVITYSILKKLGLENSFFIFFISLLTFSIPIINIIKYRLSRDKIIAKASISPTKIELGNVVYKFEEIQMCWIHFGIINKLRENDLMAGFGDYRTLQMIIILENGEKKTYHIENERKYPKLLTDLLFELKKDYKLSKIQFDESRKFDQKEFNRRMKNNK